MSIVKCATCIFNVHLYFIVTCSPTFNFSMYYLKILEFQFILIPVISINSFNVLYICNIIATSVSGLKHLRERQGEYSWGQDSCSFYKQIYSALGINNENLSTLYLANAIIMGILFLRHRCVLVQLSRIASANWYAIAIASYAPEYGRQGTNLR